MLISIVTPTLNAMPYLEECIRSVRANCGAGIEVEHIIVDAGSRDGTVELAKSYELRVLEGRDRGIFDAINKGSFNSSGELIGFLGADDVLLPKGLIRVRDAYRRRSRPWVVGGIRWIDEKGRDLGGFGAPPAWLSRGMHVCLGWNPIMHVATYMSRDFYNQMGGFDPELRDSGDFEIFARALATAPFERIAEPIACFRRTGMNNSVVNRERADRENARLLELYGPRARLEQQLWRYTLKAWFNLANPSWAGRKFRDAALWQLGLKQRRYF